MKNWVTFFKKKEKKEKWLKPKHRYLAPPPPPPMSFSPIYTPQEWDVVANPWHEEYYLDDLTSQAEFL